MKLFMFKLKVVSRTNEFIGVKVGVIQADTLAQAEDDVWKSYMTDTTCQLDVWEITPDKGHRLSAAYTVYKSEI